MNSSDVDLIHAGTEAGLRFVPDDLHTDTQQWLEKAVAISVSQ